MDNWKEVSLKDYCKTQYGYTASATDIDTGVKFVRITDIVSDFVDWNNVPYCEISGKDFIKYKLNEGDIVAARTGATVGFAKQIRKGSPDAVFASYLVKLIPSEEVDKHFLGILIESSVYRDFIQIIAGGSAQPNANAKDLTLFKFFLPPLPTQQRIASILSAYDELIEVNNQRINLLEETARELYKEWFVRMRFPSYKEAKFVKGVAEGWEVKKLSDLVSSQYGYTASATYENIGPKLLRITDIASSKIDWENVPNCVIDEKEKRKYLLKNGDIVIARTGATVGYAKRINKFHEPTVFASYLVRLIPKNPVFNYYLGIIIESDGYKEYIQTVAGGAAQPQANAGLMTLFSLYKPPVALLTKFNSVIEPMFDQMEILQQQNSELRQIRDRLLPRLISGKLKVSES